MTWKTVKEAAEIMGCSEKTIRRKIKSGDYQFKEERIGTGSPTIFVKVDILESKSKVDKSENENKVDNHNFVRKAKMENVQLNKTNSEQIINTITNEEISNLAKVDIDNYPEHIEISQGGHDICKLDTYINDKLNEIEKTAKVDILKDGQICKVDKSENSQIILQENEWITKGDLVKITSITTRTIENWSKDNKIITQKSNGLVYIQISSLADSIQNKIKIFRADQSSELSVISKEKEMFMSFAQDLKEKAWAKLAIIMAYRSNVKEAKANKIPIIEADNGFVKAFNDKTILSKESDLLAPISIKSIRRWDKEYRDSGNVKYPLCFIEKKKSACGRKGYQNKEIIRDIMQLCTMKQLNCIDIINKITKLYPDNPYSERSVRHYVHTFRKDNVICHINGSESYRVKIKPHIRRINDAFPNDQWESDGKRLNLMVYSPYWWHNSKSYRLLVRPLLIVWMDVATGYITGWSVGASETFHQVKNALVEGIVNCGIPNSLKTDNGGSYKNTSTRPDLFVGGKTKQARIAEEMLKKGDVGLYYNLGIKEHTLTTPGNAESKTIEAFWGYVFNRYEKEQFMYVGSNIMERAEHMKFTNKKLIDMYHDKIMLWTEFLSSISDYINEWNNHPRDILRNGLDEKVSPKQAFFEFSEKYVYLTQEQIERRSFYPARCTVQRDGVHINGLWYRHPYTFGRVGEIVKVMYNDKHIYEIDIYSEYGEKWAGNGQIILPGSFIDKEMSKEAIMSRAIYEKGCKALYSSIRTQGMDIRNIPELNKMVYESLDLTFNEQNSNQERDKSMGLLPDQMKILPKVSYTKVDLPEPKADPIMTLIKQSHLNAPEEAPKENLLKKFKDKQADMIPEDETPKIDIKELLKNRLGR